MSTGYVYTCTPPAVQNRWLQVAGPLKGPYSLWQAKRAVLCASLAGTLSVARCFNTGRWGKPVLVAGLVIALLLIALPVAAQNDADPAPPPRDVTHDEVNAVASQLYCPVCENEPLHTCMAPACVQWRAEIRRQLGQGQTDDQVISYFVTTYGDRVVGIPQDPTLRGLSLAAPVAVVLLALALSGLTFWRWRARRQDEPSAVPAGPTNPDDNDYRSQVERDLQY